MVANSFVLMKMRSKQECRQVKMSRKTTGKRLMWQGIIVLEIVAIALVLFGERKRLMRGLAVTSAIKPQVGR